MISQFDQPESARTLVIPEPAFHVCFRLLWEGLRLKITCPTFCTSQLVYMDVHGTCGGVVPTPRENLTFNALMRVCSGFLLFRLMPGVAWTRAISSPKRCILHTSSTEPQRLPSLSEGHRKKVPSSGPHSKLGTAKSTASGAGATPHLPFPQIWTKQLDQLVVLCCFCDWPYMGHLQSFTQAFFEDASGNVLNGGAKDQVEYVECPFRTQRPRGSCNAPEFTPET